MSRPSYGLGYVSNFLSIEWTAADLSEDLIGDVLHEYYCTVSGLSPVLASAQLRRRPPPPPYQCTAGTTNICSVDSNSLPPLGSLKSKSCKKWNYCCNQSNEFYSSWCRTEVCRRTEGQQQDPVTSQCMGEFACYQNLAYLCLGAN